MSRPLDGCGISIGAPAAWHFVSYFLRVGCVGLCFYRVRFVRFYPLCSFIAAWIAAYLPTLLSSVYRLFCTSPGALHYVASLYSSSPVNYLLSAIIRVHFFHCYFIVMHTTGRELLPRPACVSSIVYRVECAEEFFRLVRARSNNSVVCSCVNFLSCSIAKAVAIASAISSLVAVYRFI